ncbi:uncharacterized protein LOC105694585 [Orussus abietinus]|uniref:uncharacterized protein LOC105694585 n=1 Tax=Orussus abietinus TaxID=222816 RepID=UPI000626CA8A|nr:uncharacterized protein LOC105694585 [Orussus abietinus]
MKLLLVVLLALSKMADAQILQLGPSLVLNGITNAASTATNFLSGVLQRQKDLLHQVTDTATDYVVNAVEKPKNLLLNAGRATTDYIDSAASRGLEFKLRRLLERFREQMQEGMPDLGLPPMEPFKIRHLDFETHNKEIGVVQVSLDDLTLSQLSTFNVDRARLSLIGPTVTLNISIPTIHATGYYNLTGMLGDMFRLFGSGPFDARIHGFRFYVDTVLGYYRGVYMKTFDFDFSIESADLDLKEFMGGGEVGEVMNEVLESLTPEALQIVKPEVLPKVQDYVATKANETMRNLTTRDVIRILLGEANIRDFTHLLVP